MDSGHADDNRVESRSNIFVMATLYAAGGSTPVRIRNMSRSGALVEAAALPPAGTAVRLTRASLSVAGEIMWIDQRKAGVRFATPTIAADWLPNGQRGTGQQLIDEVVHQARLGALPKGGSEASTPVPADDSALHAELVRLNRLLEHAGEALAADSELAAKHLMALQAVDGVAQALAKLAAQTDAGKRAA